MTAQSSIGQYRLRRDRTFAMAIALASLLGACGPTARTESPPPARGEETAASSNPAGTALLDAERVDASFAAIPASVDDALRASRDASAAQVAALRGAAERAYREEGALLHRSLSTDAMAPVYAADVVRSLTVLAKARDATAAAQPRTGERPIAIDRALAAGPDRQRIMALSASMAASRFADERALTASRMAWALDRIRRGGPQPSLSDASDQVADMITATRQAEDAKASKARGIEHDDLVRALLRIPTADITRLTAWYGSDAGKAAKERLVGSFQGANDRASRTMLIDFLTHAGTGG